MNQQESALLATMDRLLQERGWEPHGVLAGLSTLLKALATDKEFRHAFRDLLVADDPEGVTDGFHTFQELYDHRLGLTAALYSTLGPHDRWKSTRHDDHTMYDGFFIVGLLLDGKWITYHYPLDYWEYFGGPTLDQAPPWDGSAPGDSVVRLLEYAKLEADETQF